MAETFELDFDTGLEVDAALKLAGTAVQPGDLGSAASCDIGTGSGDVAAGDHGHATAAPSGEGVPGSDGFLSAADKAKIDGLGTAAYTDSSAYAASGHDHDSAYAAAAKGVTNGDSHDHNGGDGGTIAYSSLSSKPTLGDAAAKNVGTGASDVAAGNHNHSGVYQPADADLDNWAAKTAPSGTVVGTTDAQTLSGKTITGLKETKVALSGTEIDLATGNYFSKTIAADTAFTVTNVPSTGTVASFILDLTNGGYKTITWSTGFTAVKYTNGLAPTLTVSGRDILGFFTHDAGATWNCLVLGKDVK